ncbi:MAG: hypothetical protein K1W37_07055 [Lachnospiraceae bacterium]|jgi:hypothetical protein
MGMVWIASSTIAACCWYHGASKPEAAWIFPNWLDFFMVWLVYAGVSRRAIPLSDNTA